MREADCIVVIGAGPVGLCLALALAVVPGLNALRLGDDVARAVGVDVARANWMILSAATLLTAAAVALAGMIGFVGLIVPHLARRMFGTDGRKTLVASALLGAGLLAFPVALLDFFLRNRKRAARASRNSEEPPLDPAAT